MAHMAPSGYRLLLPCDIAYLIIDQLHDDGAALKACALVCREWLPRSRYHLFRDLVVKSNHEQNDFEAFSELLDLSRHVREYICNLTLRGENLPIPGTHWPRVLLPGQQPQVTLQFLRDLIDRLPALRTLLLASVRCTDSTLDPPTTAHSPRALERLTIQPPGPVPDNFIHVLNVLGLFSEIGSFALSFGTWSDTDINVNDALNEVCWPPEGPYIRTLEIVSLRACWLSVLLQTIARRCSRREGALHSLGVGLASEWSGVETIGAFFGRVGASIRTFRFDPFHALLFSELDDPERWRVLNLEACVNLESLLLNLDFMWYSYAESEVWDCKQQGFRIYLELLSHCAPPALKRVIIRVSLDDRTDQVLGLDWQWMDRVLCALSSLEAFIVDFEECTYFAADEFTKMMPGMASKGILQLRCIENLSEEPFWSIPC
ncbi:hypothetical protein C8Q70DRAFT_521308 [Cubamyces menziesii]|uniref:Uncharacterized protein n=1 Tax=Trametes cubensis TaxID=1111947 RepID=A0AAD7XGC3_9APHY|nr:hypothetical protein C8Q70DRAFT_521308 [Cubamyces menziesii]KAJ8496734.1 hypothetical protein ONZ51_g939 [Trametes cubensis]